MNDDLNADPLIRQLADLPTISPGLALDRRIVARCHDALARQVTARARAKRARAALDRTFDVMCASAVAAYAVVAVTEAVRLALVR